MLLHVFHRHSVQTTEHFRPCFLQLQRFESQFVLHLQYIVFRSSSGAGGKLDLIGTHMLCSIDHPQFFASILSASPIHCFTLSSIHGGRSFRKPSLRWILHIMDQWLYSISDHCFDDLTNYRQNCYSSIVDDIVFASDVKRCTLSYFASVSSSETMDR
jgi:hypothetical protein